MGQVAVGLLRALQAILAVANLALAAAVYRNYISHEHQASSGALIFLIIAPAFSLTSVFYLEVARTNRHVWSHQLASLGIEGLNTIFYFVGFIAYALFLTYLTTCLGSACTMARATAVIAAGEFSAWITTSILAAKDWFESESAKATVMDGQMEQV